MAEIIEFKGDLEQIVKMAQGIRKEKLLIAIDGRCGSGKSTFGEILSDKLNGNLFHMDDFYLTKEQRTQERLKECGGNIDFNRFKEFVLERIMRDQSFTYPIYDCQLKEFSQSETVEPKCINIIEGSYCMHPALEDIYDIKIFLTTEYEKQLKRISKRNGEKAIQMFIQMWIPFEERYFKEFSVSDKSDFIIES